MGREKMLLKMLEEIKEQEKREKERKEEVEREMERQREQIPPNDKETQTDEQTYRPTGIIGPNEHLTD